MSNMCVFEASAGKTPESVDSPREPEGANENTKLSQILPGSPRSDLRTDSKDALSIKMSEHCYFLTFCLSVPEFGNNLSASSYLSKCC